MPFFTEESLESLRQRIDLVEVLSGHIDLKAAGSTYKALCPFHDEKSPSFGVKRGDSHYHCFGCGAHGDAIAFLMSHLNMSFSEAVESLAEKFNVVLEQKEGGREQQGPSKQAMRAALQEACRFYQFCLLNTPEGHEALQYLYHRGLDLDFVRRYDLGLAPREPGLFRRWMGQAGHRPDVMEAAGLTVQRDDRTRDFFFDRITFPIHDPTGHIIGFSARTWKEGAGGGKYINTPETPLFKKSRVLFGLHHCRRRMAKERRAVVVEGQLDALRMIDMGLNIAVASQGTAFGESHAQVLIDQGVDSIILAFDADKAGREAAIKVGNLFQKKGKGVTVADMPPGEDPDSYLRKYGPQAMIQLLEGATDYLRFVVDSYSRGKDMSSPAVKNQAVEAISQQIRSWDNGVMVHESLKQLASLLHVPEELVGMATTRRPTVFLQQTAKVGLGQIDADRVLEMDLLRWLVLVPEQLQRLLLLIRRNINVEDFRTPDCRKLYRLFVERAVHGKPCDLLALGSELGDDGKLLQQLMEKKINHDHAEEMVMATLQRILDREWMHRCEQIKMRLTDGKCSEDEALALAKRFGELKKNKPQVQQLPENTGEPLPRSPYFLGGYLHAET